MRQKIPLETREYLAKQPRMHMCSLKNEECNGRIEWHHALIFAGRAVQAPWAIIGVCTYHHSVADRKDLRKKIVSMMRKLGDAELEPFEKLGPIR